MSTLYDNSTPERQFDQGLKQLLNEKDLSRVDFCVGYFNLFGWDFIDELIDKIPGAEVEETLDPFHKQTVHRVCRLLIGMQQPEQEEIRAYERAKANLQEPKIDNAKQQKIRLKWAEKFRQQLTFCTPSERVRHTLQHLKKQLESGKVCVKIYLRPLHAKLYVAHYDHTTTPKASLMGSSNLTFAGLKSNKELDMYISDEENNEAFDRWFEGLWNDYRQCIDITKELIKVLEDSWIEEVTPYEIYLKVAYCLSQEFREGNELKVPTVFEHDLLEFQKIGVGAIFHYLENHGGAMIGDVVGLGKTITACAVAKAYEENQGVRALIVCPKNLVNMWEKQVNKYDLNAKVKSVASKFDTLTMPYYPLVIIDESHNLRNGGKRYNNVRNLITSFDSKVLLLTATPYNKQYSDLANQLALFLDEDEDLGIRPQAYIDSLGGEAYFREKHPDIASLTSLQAFRKSELPEDWINLMKIYLIRRTRTFVRQNYALTDAQNKRQYLKLPDGRISYFPDRLPRNLTFKAHEGDQFYRMYCESTIDTISSLKLPRYGLAQEQYRNKMPLDPQDVHTFERLATAGKRLLGFCKSTFFKRMDSSGYSFLLSLYRHVLRNEIFLYALDNQLPFPIGDDSDLGSDWSIEYEDDDVDFEMLPIEDEAPLTPLAYSIPLRLEDYKATAKQHYEEICIAEQTRKTPKIRWIPSRYFNTKFRNALLEDSNALLQIARACGAWKVAEDEKLNALVGLLNNKKKEKVVVFTQYADTAEYICQQLQAKGFGSVAVASGRCENPTDLAYRFSPESNQEEIKKSKNSEKYAEPLDILIATDVLSEGQNLQDCHIVVNFDLPWAIIRLIQRVGRVDRIGQSSANIECYSFFPSDGVENLIKLRKRLEERINTNATVIGSDEVFFEGNAQNIEDIYAGKNGFLDQDEGGTLEVDLGSQAYQIWNEAIKADPKLKNRIPNLPLQAMSGKLCEQESSIVLCRQASGSLLLLQADKQKEAIQQLASLKLLACPKDEPALPIGEAHNQRVNQMLSYVEKQALTNSDRFSAKSFRGRLVKKLSEYYEQTPCDLYHTEERKQALQSAINLLNQAGLRWSADRQLRKLESSRTAGVEALVDGVLDLYEKQSLCKIGLNQEGEIETRPTLICSLHCQEKPTN